MGRIGFGVGRRARQAGRRLAQLLTAASFGNAPWTQNLTLNRFSPYVQVNPIVVGETLDYDGTILVPQLSQTFRAGSDGLAPDSAQDYQLIGYKSWAGGNSFAGGITWPGGRFVRVIGAEWPIKATWYVDQHLYIEGCRMPAVGEGDCIYFGGPTSTLITDPYLPGACFQNIASSRQRGTNKNHKTKADGVTSADNTVALTSLNWNSATNRVTAVLSAAPPGYTQPGASFTGWVVAGTNVLNVASVSAGHKLGSGMYTNFTGAVTNQAIDNTTEALDYGQISGTIGGVGSYRLKYTQNANIGSSGAPVAMTANADSFYISGSQIAAVTTPNLQGFNQQWDYDSYDPPTRTLVLKPASFAGPNPDVISGGSNTVGTGGTLWVFNNVPGEHGDFVQWNSGRIMRLIEGDRWSPETSYNGPIIVNDPMVDISRFDYLINLTDAPLDNATEYMRIGNSAVGSGSKLKRFFMCLVNLRPSNSLANMSPGTSFGAAISTIAGKLTLLWPGRKEFVGGIIQALLADFGWTRTNLLTFSADMTSWSQNGATPPTVTADTVVAPDRTTTADTWARSATTPSYSGKALTKAATALTYTYSIYVKQKTARYFAMRLQGTYPARVDAVFDLQTGTISGGPTAFGGFAGASAKITALDDGWFRVSVTGTTDATISLQVLASFNSNGQIGIDATDSSATSDGYVWGAQLETGPNATEYIATAAAAVTVNRFANYNALGFGYIWDRTNYSGYVAPLASHMTDITFTGSNTIPESTLAGVELGAFDLTHALGRHPAYASLSIVSTNVQLGQWALRGRKLVRGRTRFDYSTTPGGVASVTIRATWAGTNQYIDRTFNFNVTNDVAAAGSNPTATLQSTVQSATPSTTTTLPNTTEPTTPNATTVSIGAAAAGRWILALATMWAGSSTPIRTISNLRIGPGGGAFQNMTKLVSKLGGQVGSTNTSAALYLYDASANVTDSTANFSFVGTGAPSAEGIQVFTLTGLPGMSPHSFNFANTDTVGGQCTIAVDIPTGGLAFVGAAFATPTSSNKRQASCFFQPAAAGTYYIRATVTGTNAGPVLWEYSTDNVTFTSVNSGGNTLTQNSATMEQSVENTGGGGTVLVSASFGAVT
ncbi:hypothetical protein [Novosphingobium sp.]|uniref:phage head spike fiber domain-containing protein n=1 Tax=Novosphingobium sp. TaxID=1874826 RepID=UPI0038B8226A